METEKIALVASLIAIVLSASTIGYLYVVIGGVSGDISKLRDDLRILTEVTAPKLELYLKAREEGKVVYATTLLSPDAALIESAFETKYPGINVEWTKGYTYPTIEKTLKEIEAGKVITDVVQFNDPAVMNEWADKGYLMHYESPEYAKIESWAKKEGYWAAVRSHTYTLYVNTKYVDVKEIKEKGWYAVLDPKYKGHIAMADPRVTDAIIFFYAMLPVLGREFWQTLGKQDVALTTGYTVIYTGVAAGEYWIGLMIPDNRAFEYKAKGAPVDGIYTLPGSLVLPYTQAILAGAPHPNAAKLFFDFCLSYELQKMFADEFGVASPRTDAPSLIVQYPDMILPKDLPNKITGYKIITVDWTEFGKAREDAKKEFIELFGLG